MRAAKLPRRGLGFLTCNCEEPSLDWGRCMVASSPSYWTRARFSIETSASVALRIPSPRSSLQLPSAVLRTAFGWLRVGHSTCEALPPCQACPSADVVSFCICFLTSFALSFGSRVIVVALFGLLLFRWLLLVIAGGVINVAGGVGRRGR